ncbi:putative general amidase GmdA [Saccharata proteae CBS 121410]|uniref:amidase n=1 Tax=Saccharata proteae CBS 121410 TaxID=1314787 RepID=A0A9P4LYK4_9PEZI|nr:putative general amidase GmdA [Saccharata proteae CBS 121410]
MSPDWQQLAKAKRDSIAALIPKEWILENVPTPTEQRDVTGTYVHQYLSQKEIEITETDAVGIVAKTTAGAWTAVDVARAFCHRAAIAHQLVNCLHEIAFDDALATAAALDAHYAQHKAPVGPLHGLPVSLKDQFHVRGLETTMGYVGWIGTFEGRRDTGKEKVFESEMVKELRELGAVLYCKTSVPHTLMHGETENNIVGYTMNPRNRLLSCGGSSGGEGALIAMRGSVLGFGTDIGGSIRIPAAFNGVYGIRPSSGRLPYEGMANSMDGQNTILSVVGPLAASVPSLTLAVKALLSKQPWLGDPLVHEIPWRSDQEQQVLDIVGSGKPGKLSFGVLRHDGLAAVTPPVKRAIEITVQTLQKLGHEVIEWQPPSHKRISDTALETWLFDGGDDCMSAFELSGEQPRPNITPLYKKRGPKYTASDIARVNVAKRQLQKEYLDYWNSTVSQTGTGRPVDAIIAPAAPWPAVRPGMYYHIGYTTCFNLLDYTSAVLPVTKVDKSIDKVDAGFKALSDVDQKCQDAYDPEIYDGSPVALQLVGRRLQEEKVLALAAYVDGALKTQ